MSLKYLWQKCNCDLSTFVIEVGCPATLFCFIYYYFSYISIRFNILVMLFYTLPLHIYILHVMLVIINNVYLSTGRHFHDGSPPQRL